jgi:hypothetical protein
LTPATSLKLSPLAYSFIAGQLKQARALAGGCPYGPIPTNSGSGYEAPYTLAGRKLTVRADPHPRYTEGMHKATRAELPSRIPPLTRTWLSTPSDGGFDGIDNKLTPPTPLNNLNSMS